MGKSSAYSKKTTRADVGAAFVLDPPPSVRWRVWPLLEQPSWGACIVAAITFTGLITHWATDRPQLGLLVSFALMAAIWRFFLPTSFELDRHGLDQRRFGHHRRVPWKAIRRHERCEAGVLLLPRTDDCPLDRLRGLFLPWAEKRDEVLAQIDFHLGGRG